MALLVVAADWEFEAGIAKHGQTRGHATICYILGIKRLIVAINRMDAKVCDWSEQRFNEIKNNVEGILKKIGYNPEQVSFIPVSALQKENLFDRSTKMTWWKGPTLMEAFNALPLPKRSLEKPLRIPIQAVYDIGGIGTVAVGKIVSGS